MTGNNSPVVTGNNIELRIDIEPRGWDRATHWKGRTITSAKQRAYQNRIKGEAKLAMIGKQPFTGGVCVTVGAFFPIAKSWTKAEKQAAFDGVKHHTSKPDSDNVLKTILDSFKGIVWKDDCQVCQATVMKRYSSAPALTVTVRSA